MTGAGPHSETTPKASIVVPTRGGVERLPHLFEALRAQTEKSWEAIVVVDGDIDNTEALLAEAARDLPIAAIVFPENRGRSAALNAGFAAARGDVFIRCDDDLRPKPNYVEEHVKQHQSPARGVIGLVQNIYPETPYARAYGNVRDSRFRDDAYALSPEARWRHWCGNVSVTRETYAHVGPYDTNFRAYGWEDVDWGYRLKQTGAEIVFAPRLETPHHIAAVTTEARVKRAFYSGAAKQSFALKHGKAALGASPSRRGAWDKLIKVTAKHNGLQSLLRHARRADTFLDRMPRWVAEKGVSWLIESAALSGEIRPEQVENDV